MESNTYGGIEEESAGAIIVVFFYFRIWFSRPFGYRIGIAGIFQKTRERIKAIIRTIISSAKLIITVSIVRIGFAMGY